MIALGSTAHAAAPCEAPWMHRDGQFVIESSPSKYTFTFDVLSFDKKDGDHCVGTIRTTTGYDFGGQNKQAHSTFAMTIEDGIAEVKPQQDAGDSTSGKTGAGTMQEMISRQLSGFLSYAGAIKQAGQTLPATSSRASLDLTAPTAKEAPEHLTISNMSLTTSEKTVSQQEALDTVAGKLDCWRVIYNQTEETGDMIFHGRTTKSTTLIMHVVDYFCPATGLVMRKDLTMSDGQTSQSVISIK